MGMLLAVLSFFSGSALLLREQRFSCASSSPRALCLKGESKRGAEEGERRGARRAKEESREEDEDYTDRYGFRYALAIMEEYESHLKK